MLIVRSAAEWAATFKQRSTVTVGNFDGLHLGHQKILGSVVVRARSTGTLAAVVTFDPHPLKVLRPAQAPRLLQTYEQRLAGFESLGIEATLLLNFNPELAILSPEAFAGRILREQLGAAAILVGQNFRFGYKQAGDVAVLQEIGQRSGFQVEIVPPVIVEGEVVSSTAVRLAVATGRVEDATRFLGRPFALTGKVQRGAGRGTTILVPTLNLAAEQELLPKVGVYATETIVGEKSYRSATNVGFRPTFDGKTLSIESHLFDFSKIIVEGALEVRFRRRLRDELKLNSVDELRRQIAADLQQARDFFGSAEAATELQAPTVNK